MRAALKFCAPSFLRRAVRRWRGVWMTGLRKMGAQRSNSYPEGAVFYTLPGRHVFFGYYDISPFHQNLPFLLAGYVDVTKPDDMTIGYFDLNQPDHFVPLSSSSLWNWQQGCRLQWMPGRSRHVFFNALHEDRAAGMTVNIDTKEVQRLTTRPLYAIDAQGRFGLSVDFARLHRFRPGYGYAALNWLTADAPAPEDDGLWRVDLDTGAETLILSYRTLADFMPEDFAHKGWHYINHADFIPGTSDIQLFHLVHDAENPAAKKRARLITLNKDGRNIEWLARDMRPSHYCWLSSEDVLLTGIKFDGVFTYATINRRTGAETFWDSHILSSDGHPRVKDNRIVITDTYPDIWGRQHLLQYDRETHTKRTIASFYLPPSFHGPARCDLHPRLSPDQSLVCVDIVQHNRRAMAIIPINQLTY